MNARFQPGDYEARHSNPAWGDRANFVIAANISDSPGDQREWEQLWALQLNENQFEICCIPFFVYDLALGDMVETDRNYIVSRVLMSSGHATFRCWFGDSKHPEGRASVLATLNTMKCEYEWSSVNLLAIDAATSKVSKALAKKLGRFQRQGFLQYETSRAA